MLKVKYLGTLVLLAALGGLAFVAAGPTAAMPGWSHPDRPDASGNPPVASINDEQREEIRQLHGAYRAALAELDWSVGQNGHASETMQQARELQMALRAEIFDVLHRDSEATSSTDEGGCPYSGRAIPVKLDSDAPTLYL